MNKHSSFFRPAVSDDQVFIRLPPRPDVVVVTLLALRQRGRPWGPCRGAGNENLYREPLKKWNAQYSGPPVTN